MGMGVDGFTLQLEEGLVTPELNLTNTKTRAPWCNRHAGIELLHVDYIYKFVWNDLVLEDGSTFGDYMLAHGMSLDEPNDIYVVTKKWVHTVMDTGP